MESCSLVALTFGTPTKTISKITKVAEISPRMSFGYSFVGNFVG
jgi:hypothetical protein